MHEYGLARSIVKSVLKKLRDTDAGHIQKITTLKLQVGKLNNVTPEALEQAVHIVAGDSLLSGVKLEVEETPNSELTVIEVIGECNQ